MVSGLKYSASVGKSSSSLAKQKKIAAVAEVYIPAKNCLSCPTFMQHTGTFML